MKKQIKKCGEKGNVDVYLDRKEILRIIKSFPDYGSTIGLVGFRVKGFLAPVSNQLFQRSKKKSALK